MFPAKARQEKPVLLIPEMALLNSKLSYQKGQRPWQDWKRWHSQRSPPKFCRLVVHESGPTSPEALFSDVCV